MKISIEVWRMASEPHLIHLAASDGTSFHSQVTKVEGHAGYDPYLYGTLAGMLEAAGEEPLIPKVDRRWLANALAGRMPHKCSFCGRTEAVVSRLIAGPGVFICDECINLCNEIFEEEGFPDWPWRSIDPGE